MLRRLGLIDLFGLIIGGVLIFVTDTFVGDPGVGWHLKTGELISATHQVPQVDPFLFRVEGQRWISNQWLADLFFWKIYQCGGFPLLHVALVGVILIIYVFILGPLLSEVRDHASGAFLVIFLASMLGSVQWTLRPVVFSFLLFSIVYCLLYRWQEFSQKEFVYKSKRMLPVFFGIFVLWSNLHPGFPLGFMLIGLALFSIIFEKRFRGEEKIKRLLWGGGIAFVSFVATVINPYGLELHRNILGLVGDPYFMNLNTEWFSVDFYSISFYPFLAAITILLLSSQFKRHSKFNTFELLVAGLFLFLAIEQRRYIPFFGVVSAVIFLKCIPTMKGGTTLQRALENISRKDRLSSRGAYTAFLWGAVLLFCFSTGRIPFRTIEEVGFRKTFPKEAVTQIKEDGSKGRIFHTPDWGGYITWTLWPTQKAFADDRNELNGQEVYEEYFSVSLLKKEWREILQKYDFKWIITHPQTPLAVALSDSKEGGWREFFRKEDVVVFKRGELEQMIEAK